MNMILIGIGVFVLFIIFVVGGIFLGRKLFAPKDIQESQQFQN